MVRDDNQATGRARTRSRFLAQSGRFWIMLRRLFPALLGAIALVFLSCAPSPRFAPSRRTVAVAVHVGGNHYRFRLSEPARVQFDGRRAVVLAKGAYRFELVGAQFASNQIEMARAFAGSPGSWLVDEVRGSAGLVLLTSAGREVGTARREIRIVNVRSVRGSHDEPGFALIGELAAVPLRGRLVVVNNVPLEAYVAGVVAAEMASNAPLAALQAQAVAARTNALALRRSHRGEPFDVCATTHCQVYRGVPDSDSRVWQAVRSTRSLILWYKGLPARALYSANCGGHTESAAALWGGPNERYLEGVLDASRRLRLDLSDENVLRKWLSDVPKVFCAKGGSHFRWTREISEAELRRRIREARGVDIGELQELKVLRRGVSGRATEVEVVGSRGRILVRGELTIRQLMADPPLPSSCFVVVGRTGGRLVLRGAGYGHGVGLCQDGAAAMARRGYDFVRILQHYYPGTSIELLR